MLDRIITKEGYDLITVQEAADLCGVTPTTLWKWIERGFMDVMAKKGRVVLVDRHQAIEASKQTEPRYPRRAKPRFSNAA